jgi:hypothetical protein
MTCRPMICQPFGLECASGAGEDDHLCASAASVAVYEYGALNRPPLVEMQAKLAKRILLLN